MSARTAKADRRKVRKVLGDGAPVLIEAHEEGLKAHAEILRRSVGAGFFGRLRWLLFGLPTDSGWHVNPEAKETEDDGQ